MADIDRYRQHSIDPIGNCDSNGGGRLPFVSIGSCASTPSISTRRVERHHADDELVIRPAKIRWILEEPARLAAATWTSSGISGWQRGQGRLANLRATLHGMQHPIHFHGQRFLVLDQNGVRNTNLAWKDTFLLPAGGTADILLKSRNPGSWLATPRLRAHGGGHDDQFNVR